MTDHAHEALRGFCRAHGLERAALDDLAALVDDLLAHERERIAAAVEGRPMAEAECERLRGVDRLKALCCEIVANARQGAYEPALFRELAAMIGEEYPE